MCKKAYIFGDVEQRVEVDIDRAVGVVLVPIHGGWLMMIDPEIALFCGGYLLFPALENEVE